MRFILILSLFLFSCARHNPAPAAAPTGPAPVPAKSTDPKPTPTPTPKVGKHHPHTEAFSLQTQSLYNYREQEIAGLTEEDISARNDSDIQAFAAFTPEIQKSTTSGGLLSFSSAEDVLQALMNNPVASPYETKYQRPDVKIGYCFGRATFIHLALKKMGLQSSSIRKLWIVGPMHAGSVDWGFHVAPAAFVDGYGWMVLDSNLGRPVSVRQWFDHYSPMSTDQRLRIYFTSPQRFGVTIPKYDRVDLGFNLPEERDWYQHYFVDLMAWFRTADFKAMGLSKVAPATRSSAPSATSENDIYSSRPSRIQ